jgi:hypothetical protein
MTMTNKKNDMNDDAEYGVDSRYKNSLERESEAAILMEARIMRIKLLSKDQIMRARLIQLKFKMEEYIKKPVYGNQSYFSEFLKTYIDTIYTKRSFFAKDIDITPVSLSQVINNHREPREEFILKLMIHSEKVYKDVCEFHKEVWYQVFFHEKICGTMSSQAQWRPKIEKHVKLSETI